MDLIAKFTLPGLATALVFYVAIMSCPWKFELLRVHWAIDIGFTTFMMVFLAGTFSGAMTASIGGIILTGLLWGTWYFFYEPIPRR